MKGYSSMLPGLALGLVATTALADPVGGDVDAISTVTNINYVSDIDIVAASGLSNAVIVSATINNNDANGWDLTVTSANGGKLRRGAGGAGREIAYNNITLVRTGGTLGAGLTDPTNSVRSVTTVSGPGVAHFFTHDQETGTGTATSATVDYTFELRISASADASLLSGSYTDNITLSVSNDS